MSTHRRGTPRELLPFAFQGTGRRADVCPVLGATGRVPSRTPAAITGVKAWGRLLHHEPPKGNLMSLFTTLIGGKLIVGAFAVGSIALGGTAAAACTGALPTALQEQAHVSFGVPAPQGDDGATPTET